MTASNMHIKAFFDTVTGTVSYVLADIAGGQAAVIDPVLDFEPKSGTLSSRSADSIIDYVRSQGWQVQWILETHAHADHLSAAQHIRYQLGGKVAIGAHIRKVQAAFRKIYHFERSFLPDGSQFDHLLDDGESLPLGQLLLTAIHVPGHTPADMAYRVADAVFVGDTLFMPDVGTARADFPGGDAAALYQSIHRILDLPPQTRIFVCHDYPPASRAPAWQTTVREQREHNIHVRDGISQSEFVQMRTARDATLEMPTLILPSVQVNVRAGKLPPAQEDGRTYVQLPINAFAGNASMPQGVWQKAPAHDPD
ncbi:MAG: MBL fold metallo-hydrolase [Comamonas sp.]|jgi:glyoxylase-like metal-dependent hydrolase (beta-lactamase superfamily II)|uniref:MBL fold metallo-hydrolase n=1 Tax=Comamonas sp. TaxID=34028 RepID=UPI00281DBE76|nr:MBL fold metallo-hydrolase [Comamonas sp.]MDR0213832.1 MBL fold metallo-hydrolase [Comamonas sp.]